MIMVFEIFYLCQIFLAKFKFTLRLKKVKCSRNCEETSVKSLIINKQSSVVNMFKRQKTQKVKVRNKRFSKFVSVHLPRRQTINCLFLNEY